MAIAAVLFDKDGTLFNFSATWSGWARTVIDDLAQGDVTVVRELERVLHYDVETGSFAPTSPVIAQTTHEVAALIAPVLGESDIGGLAGRLNLQSERTRQVPAVDLPRCLGDLRARNLRIGLVTNDSEAAAYAHLEQAGILDLFDFVAGYDSGYGAKPEPGQLLAFLAKEGVDPINAAMVGDSTHDMAAARAAGTHAVGVLTGLAAYGELAPMADVVLDDIGGLGRWLDTQNV